jgi:hypothetical protein
MALSYVTYPGNGSDVNFSVTFPYIEQADVSVYVDGVLQTVTTHYTWFSSTVIQFLSPPAGGTLIKIARTTQDSARLVDFQDAGNLTEADLDLSANQNFFLIQEGLDNYNDLSMQLAADDKWDAESKVIKNLADPTNAQDATTKTYVDNYLGDTAQAVVTQLANDGDVAQGDAMVALKRTLTGAVASTLHDYHESRFVNAVVDFSVDNTGVTDCSTALQAAVDSISKGVVFLPAGIYLINTGIIVPAQVRIVGESMGSTTVNAGANSMTLFTWAVTGTTKFFFGIERVALSGNAKTSVTGIDIHGTTSSIRASNVGINDMYLTSMAVGIDLELCANVDIMNIQMAACTVGYRQTNCADVDLSMIQVQNGTSYGFHIIGSTGGTAYDEGFRMTNCSTNGQGYGMLAVDMDFGDVAACSFTTCVSGPPCKLENCTQWNFVASEFAAADATPPTYVGLQFDNTCDSCTVNGCNFLLNGYGLLPSGQKHAISGNRFSDNDVRDIFLSNTLYSCVTGNVMASTGPASSLTEAGTSNYNLINGNVSDKTQSKLGANSVVSNTLVY